MIIFCFVREVDFNLGGFANWEVAQWYEIFSAYAAVVLNGAWVCCRGALDSTVLRISFRASCGS